MDYTYTYTSSGLDSSSTSPADLGMFVGVTLIFCLIFIVAAYAISSFLTSRIFKKAGVKQSIAWIPIYNTWKMLELGDQKGFWAPLMMVPGVNIASAIFLYIAMYHIGKKFGKEDWFIVLAILVVPVWYIILGFDKSQWNGGVSAGTTAGAQPAYAPPLQAVDLYKDPQPKATPASTEPAAPSVEPEDRPTDTTPTPSADTYDQQ